MGTNYNVTDTNGLTRSGTATNNVETGPNGIILTGSGRKYKKIPYGVGEMTVGGVPPAFTVLNNIIAAYSFKKNVDETLIVESELPNDYEDGTDIILHIDWCPTTTGTNNVVWQITYNTFGIGGLINSSGTQDTKTEAALGVAYAHQETNIFVISGLGVTTNTHLTMNIGRIGSNVADTYDASALVYSIHIEYIVNKIGTDI